MIQQLFDAKLASDAPRPEILIRKGDPHAHIVAVADARDDDLIVMGGPRKRAFLESLRGTTLERVIRAITRPVLSVRNPAKGPDRNVVFATDMSECAVFALQTAHRLTPRRARAVSSLKPACPARNRA